MTCPRCLAEVPADAEFCSGCGTRVDRAPTPLRSAEPPGAPHWEPPGAQAPGPPGPQGPPHAAGRYAYGTPPPAPLPPVQFDLGRLTPADRAIGGASLVALITLFLPWFGFSAVGYSFSQSGIAAHGYLGIALL